MVSNESVSLLFDAGLEGNNSSVIRRVAAGIIENSKKEVLIIESLKYKDHLFLPSGKIEEGESYISGLIREIKEELGVDVGVNKRPTVKVEWKSETHGKPCRDLICIYRVVDVNTKEIRNMEPEKHKRLIWADKKGIYKLARDEKLIITNALQAYLDTI